LAEAVHGSRGKFKKAYLVLGGGGWTLRDYYVSGDIRHYLRNCEPVEIVSLETFVARANQGRLWSHTLREKPFMRALFFPDFMFGKVFYLDRFRYLATAMLARRLLEIESMEKPKFYANEPSECEGSDCEENPSVAASRDSRNAGGTTAHRRG